MHDFLILMLSYKL